jgi:hypothetical protein
LRKAAYFLKISLSAGFSTSALDGLDQALLADLVENSYIIFRRFEIAGLAEGRAGEHAEHAADHGLDDVDWVGDQQRADGRAADGDHLGRLEEHEQLAVLHEEAGDATAPKTTTMPMIANMVAGHRLRGAIPEHERAIRAKQGDAIWTAFQCGLKNFGAICHQFISTQPSSTLASDAARRTPSQKGSEPFIGPERYYLTRYNFKRATQSVSLSG